MYLRETQRRNADGSVVSYLALAHNERDRQTGTPKAKIIHNFGRADQVDRQALARLVRSIGRYLDPAEATAAAVPGEVDILDARPMGTAYTADRLWARLGVGAAITRVAAGRRVDPGLAERVIFAMVANRLCPTPLSKLAGAAWVTNRVFIPGLPELSDDACYRAMDFLLDALPMLQQEVFFAVANLLNLEVDLLFFDGSSTYWETDSADTELLDSDEDKAVAEAATGEDLQKELPLEGATRRYGRSKDHRPDLPQVVIGLAVTREGVPVRLWTFPGDTSEQLMLRTVKDDLRAWNLNRVIWVVDRGFTSAANRRYLQRGGGHHIMGEKLRSDSAEAATALGRAGRYRTVAGNLRVKEIRIDDGTNRDRFVICHNPERATRDAEVRAQILTRLEQKIAGSDRLPARKRAELAGALKTKPAFNRFLRTTPGGKLRIDHTAVSRETHYDGKFLLRTSDETLSAADIAEGYKALYEAERGFRDLKSTIDIRPVYHHKDQRIQAHIQLCWLALLLLRVAELACHDTWRNLRDDLERLHLVVLRTAEGTIAQRSELTARHKEILRRLHLPEPPRFYQFTPADTPPAAGPPQQDRP
jgi:Transposase DDE domain